jgi:choline dehydrogenase-like flavoprotein
MTRNLGWTENLQDHIMCGPSVEVEDTITTADVGRDPSYTRQAMEAYERSRTGPLAEGGTYSFAYQPLQMLNSDVENAQLQALVEKHLQLETVQSLPFPSQKVQFDFISHAISDPNEATATIYLSRKQRHMDKSTPEEVNAISSPEKYLSIIAMLSHPFSRGNVHIRSSDPAEKPAVDFKYLTHPLDVEILASHICSFRKLIACEPLASCVKPNGRRLPASFPKAMESVEQAKEMLWACAATNYHPAGTCAMMSKELGGVVNERLVVYGTENLRVCDASIMPIIPRGNFLSSVYAVAEKGSDIIKEDLRNGRARSAQQKLV